MSAGVYKIEHTPTGRVYIGSSKNMRNRMGVHRWSLRLGRHHSAKLQRSWNRHPEGEFAFSVVLICSEEHLLFYEQLLIDGMGAASRGFNVLPTAGSATGFYPTAANKANMRSAQRAIAKKYEWKGALRCITEIAELEGVRAKVLERRVNEVGWAVEEAVNTPVVPQNRRHSGFGKSQTVAAWAEEVGCGAAFLRKRLAKGECIEECVAKHKTWTKHAMARSLGVDPNAFMQRLRNGWSTGDALGIPVAVKSKKSLTQGEISP